jgi:hypothetical protein
MAATFATIHLCALSDQIETYSTHLEHLALTKSLAPTRRVNKSFSRPLHLKAFYEATNEASWRI